MFNGENIFINPTEKRLRALWRLSIQFILFFGAYLLPVYFLDNFKNHFTQNLVDEFATLLFVFTSIWIAAKLLDKRKISDIGFKFRKHWFTNLLEGMVLGAIIFFLIFLIEMSMNWVEIESVVSTDSPVEFAFMFFGRFMGFFAVALMEESFSRGYQIKNISEGLYMGSGSEKKAIVLALIISSAIFSLMHAGNPNTTVIGLINLTFIGIFYGYAFVASGSLAMPIGIHTTWNFMQGNVFGFPVSGIAPEIALLKIKEAGPELITGGSFGPEAGLIIFVGIVFGFLALNFILFKNPLKFSLDKSFAYYNKG